LRRAPKSEYLLLEDQPANNTGYTLTLNSANKKIILKEKENVFEPEGTNDHKTKTNLNLKKGMYLNNLKCNTGVILLLVNNLTASAIGCNKPTKAGLLGPSRS